MPLDRILLVDDSEADQFIASIIINDYAPEAQLSVAFNGNEALDILGSASEVPQVILLDINMPVMNGFEFLEPMEAKYPNSSIVVGMMSSSNAEEDRIRAATHDCVKLYIEKPLSPESLASVTALIS